MPSRGGRPFLYAVALGSNRRGRAGDPPRVLRAALGAIGGVKAASAIITTAPLGPSTRRYANMVALVETAETPPELLARLKAVEHSFGRRPGQRWGARVLDLDIILWSGGAWAGPGLVVPHAAFRKRHFVLAPLAGIAPGWRDPLSGRTMRQLASLLALKRQPTMWRRGMGP
ncbi:MAG: 2-amino-4-hydroxy-6-hydroxymethyldihydropteridine diphosphokinase [Sphingomonas sp.]|nr:2-amino-4-hydroxy-6-hydroxymethyldihydropteridine diphosphokinase [Sphingomonas sp.]